MEDDYLENQVNNYLKKRDYEGLIELNKRHRHVWRILQSNMYHTDDILRWYTIEAVAAFMRRRWDNGEKEKVRDYLRRLIWSITDESGGIGWSASQTIAEIVAAIPELSEPWVSNMVDRAFKEPALVKSGLWGIGRLGENARKPTELFNNLVLASFDTDDIETLGLATWALGEVRLHAALPHINALINEENPVRIYVSPRIHERPLSDWAKDAVKRITGGS